MPRPVFRKTDFYARAARGEFGTQLRRFPDPDAAVRAVPDGWWAIRSQLRRGGGGNGPFEFMLDEATLRRKWAKLRRKYSADELFVSEVLHDDDVQCQLEVHEIDGPRVLWFSTVQTHCRDSLRLGGRHYYGGAARLVLKAAFPPHLLDELDFYLDAYPNHCIEAALSRRPMGDRASRLIIWECRRY